MGDAFPELKREPAEGAATRSTTRRRRFLRTPEARASSCSTSIAERDAKEDGPHGRRAATDAFQLHDTYGVLIDITAADGRRSRAYGRHGRVRAAMEERAEARPARAGKKFAVAAVQGRTAADRRLAEVPARADRGEGARLGEGQRGRYHRQARRPATTAALLLDRTNFYAEQGGQVGDTGHRSRSDRRASSSRSRTRSGSAKRSCTSARCIDGELTVGDTVDLEQTTTAPHRHHAEPHRHAPAQPRAAAGARRRTSSRRARSSMTRRRGSTSATTSR